MNQLATVSAWGPASAWRVLELAGEAVPASPCRALSNLEELVRHWRTQNLRPSLHYVLLLPAMDEGDLQTALNDLQPGLGWDWLRAGQTLRPGFHRYELESGRVLLTICTGALRQQLRQLQFAADAIWLPACADVWERWQGTALARCSQLGTKLVTARLDANCLAALAQVGFSWENRPADAAFRVAHFQPFWLPAKVGKSTRPGRHPRQRTTQPLAQSPDDPSKPSCIVVGAGLAGAAVAHALAQRGWRVKVLDALAEPAQEASGLPVGLLGAATSNSAPELASPLVRLSWAGVSLCLQQAQRLLQPGMDWQASGLLTIKPDGQPGWQSQAAWIRPAALVRAWLKHPQIQFVGNTQVAACRAQGSGWDVMDPQDQVIATASLVVLANASKLGDVWARTVQLDPSILKNETRMPTPLQPVAGQISWGLHTPDQSLFLPRFPINGAGHLIAHVPQPSTKDQPNSAFWLLGAGYETASPNQPPATIDAAHRHLQNALNWQRLNQQLPGAAHSLQAVFERKKVNSWRNVRAVSPDRLPMVGPLFHSRPGLWYAGAFGSRGLSWAALCAEILAAQLHGEPLPIEASLVTKIGVR